MSFGISLTDILKIIEGCLWLQDRFDKNNSADERLKQFINDIKLLENRLRRLAPALEDALERYEEPDVDGRELRCDLHSVIGDVEQSILEAKELVNRHIKIQRNAAGFIHNVVWAAHAEPRVDLLRKAMQFQAQKIFLVIEPVSLKLLTTIDGKMDEMLEKLDRLLGEPPYQLSELAAWLDNRFRVAALQNQPIPFDNLNSIPLKEGFDALYLHFRDSTYAFRDPETAEQTAEQYLNLLKCQWLLNALRKGDQFHRAGTLYPRLLKQVEQRVIKQHKRPDVVRFPDTQLRMLSPTAFMIWPPEQVVDVRNATDPNEGEHVILQLTLPTPSTGEKDSVVVFRTGPTTLRIAKRSTDRAGTPYYENEHYNMHQDVLLPFYAIAETPAPNRQSVATFRQPSASISIYRGNGTGAIDYRLSSETDVFNFQRAITGYQVVFDKKVTWAIKQSDFRGQLLRGRGTLQIWHWKPLEEVPTPNEQQPTSLVDSTHSPLSSASTTSDSVVETILQRRDTSRVTIDERSTKASVISATTPPHPVIIIYGQQNDVFTYYYIDLDFGFQINPSACPCESESKKPPQAQTCLRSVIELHSDPKSPAPSPFITRAVSASKSALPTWNLGFFAQPRHPSFNSRRVVQKQSSDFLNVDFARVEDRLEFKRKFDKALQLRDRAEREHRRIIEMTRYLGEKNGKISAPKAASRRASQAESVMSLPRLTEKAPTLRPISPVSTFAMSYYGEDKELKSERRNGGDRDDGRVDSMTMDQSSTRTMSAFTRSRRWLAGRK